MPVSVAFDADGKPTPALLEEARGAGSLGARSMPRPTVCASPTARPTRCSTPASRKGGRSATALQAALDEAHRQRCRSRR